MKYYALLVTHLETEMDKEWDELNDTDCGEMDRKAFEDLKKILEYNQDYPENFSFRHYRTFDDLCDELDM